MRSAQYAAVRSMQWTVGRAEDRQSARHEAALWPSAPALRTTGWGSKTLHAGHLPLHTANCPLAPLAYNEGMDPFQVVKQNWSPGDMREVEAQKIERQIGVDYDSYRKVYIADGHEWTIAGQIARPDGKKYYILECVS
jgi:hypothetical protein